MASTDEPPATWRGTTAEERTAPRRARLIEAAFELLGDPDSGGATVRRVCSRAGLNPRYFYESFDDLDDLIGAVYAQLIEETNRLSLAAIVAAPNTAEDKTRAAIGTSLRHLAADPRRLRILFDATATRGVLVKRRAATQARLAGQMADLAAAFYGIPRDDKLLMSSTVMLTGGLAELVIAWHNGTLDLTLDELIDHTVLLVVGTSRAAGAIARASERAD